VNPYHQEAQAASFKRYDWRSHTDIRDALVAKYAWAIPNDNAIQLLAGMGPIIEMGAGNGYWAKLIVDAGGKIEPYDVKPGQHHYDAPPRSVWYPVIDGGPDQITVRHRDHILLLVWPPYEGALAFDALTRYLEVGGKTVVFVGEGSGGCTADDRFYNLLDSQFEEVGDTDIPQWDGIHDYLTVYQRKTAR
jgi:hypothetical protein